MNIFLSSLRFLFSKEDKLEFVQNFLQRCLDNNNYEWFDKGIADAPGIRSSAQYWLTKIKERGLCEPSEADIINLKETWNRFVSLREVAYG